MAMNKTLASLRTAKERRETNRGQTCDFCDFGFDSPGCGACAPLFQPAGGDLALTSDLAEGITIKNKSRALSVYV